MSAPRTARERVREEMSSQILAVARAHMARDGAAALSLRSVARDLEMAPSALYRYFDGRDALLSALILGAYESLAAEAERAADAAEAGHAGDAERFQAVARAMRAWALANPHEWGLVFGTPVPGYQAPEATVVPYARVAAAMVRPLVAARAAGRLAASRALQDRTITPALAAAVAPVTEGLFPAGMPAEKVVLAVQAWTTVVGLVSLEVFGHWRNTILDPSGFFEATVRDLADARLGLV